MGQAIIELEHEEDIGKALDLHKQYLGQRFVEGKQYSLCLSHAKLFTELIFSQHWCVFQCMRYQTKMLKPY